MAYPDFTPEELATEEWREVKGFGKDTPNKQVFYQVSNLGRVRAFSMIMLKATTFGSPQRTGNDYTRVTLLKKGQSKPVSIHRLVAQSFIGNPSKDRPYVNHKDGKKDNNRHANLEYVSPSENNLHAFAIGLTKPGQGVGTAKLTDIQAAEIIQRLASGEMANDIAKDYPISNTIINRIRKNTLWTHIPRPNGLSDPLPSWTKLHPERLKHGDANPSRARYDLIPKGEDSHNAKVTEANVRTIRELYASGNFYMRELADKFSISFSQIKRIIDRKTWKQVN